MIYTVYYLKQINIFIEMVIYLDVGCKNDTRLIREGLNVYEFPREENLKQQWLIKIKCRNIQSIEQARINLGWKKLWFQLVLNKTFCPNPQPLTHRRLKQRQRTKINKTMHSLPSLSPPHQFSTQGSQYQNWKANKYSILTVKMS